MIKLNVGDRVVVTGDDRPYSKTRVGEMGTIKDMLSTGCEIVLDNKALNRDLDGVWYASFENLQFIKEEKPMKYDLGDHVELVRYGLELTSKSLKVGDRGEVKDFDAYSRSYLVTFTTCNGPRNQWAKEEDLSPVSNTLDSRIEELEKELEALKAKQEEDKWVDITDECSINSSFDVYHGDSLLLQGYSTNYKTEGMRVFKKKESV